MIHVAIEGVFAPVLEGGISRSKLDDIIPDIRNAHRELMSRRGKDIGFYDAPLHQEILKAIAGEVKRLRSLADDMLVLGIGGSSLGGQAIVSALKASGDPLYRAHFVDNVDPDTFGVLLERLKPERTVAVAITKSGGTVETLAQLLIIRRWFRSSLGQGEMRSRMTFVTDPQKGLLRQLANSEGIRAFDIPPNIGGRYSVLTPVGLLPAAFVDIDIESLTQGAAEMIQRVTHDNVLENPACLFAAGAFLAAKHLGRSSLVMMPYCDALRVTTAWFVQLWAESLGKRLNRLGEVVHAGQTPIPALGATDQHSQVQLFIEGPRDKAVCLVEVEKSQRSAPIPDELPDHDSVKFLHGRDLADLLAAERRGTRAAMLDAGVPVLDISIPKLDAASLGELFVLFEAACACMGMMLGINPFDQPGVETGKRMALGLLGKSGYDEDVARVKAREAKGQTH